jgi:hypothetical protein
VSGNTVPIELDPIELEFDSVTSEHVLDPGATPGPRRARLQVVPRVFRRGAHSRVFMAATTLGTLGAILAAQLILSIFTSQGAYEVSSLELEQRDLLRVERVLSQNVEKLASPQNLAENAAKLGMAVNATPAYLRLSDGAVLGEVATRTQAAAANTVANELLTDEAELDRLLAQGAQKANEIAERTLALVYDRLGFVRPGIS